MIYLTITDYALIVDDIMENKWDLLLRFAMGPIFGTALRERRPGLNMLARTLEKRPLADKLREADGRYNELGRSIFHLGEALRTLSMLSAESRETIAKTCDALVPALSTLVASCQDEAYAARKNRTMVDDGMADRLKAFPIGNITLYDLANGFVDRGIEIDTLLLEAVKYPDAVKAGRLRSEIMGLLGRLRATVHDEIQLNTALPANLEVDLFSYMDQIQANREAQTAAAAADRPQPPIPPATLA